MAYNGYADRGLLLVNNNVLIEPADFNRIQFTLNGNFVLEDGMTTDGTSAGFTYKNQSATIAVEFKIPNNRPIPDLFSLGFYDGNIVQIQVLGVRNLSTGDYQGNNVVFPNCKYIDTGMSGYSRAGTAGVVAINFASTQYTWIPASS